eukprot:5327988-Prymnesium_polylepis.1
MSVRFREVCAKRGVRRTHIVRVRTPRAGPEATAVPASISACYRAARSLCNVSRDSVTWWSRDAADSSGYPGG